MQIHDRFIHQTALDQTENRRECHKETMHMYRRRSVSAHKRKVSMRGAVGAVKVSNRLAGGGGGGGKSRTGNLFEPHGE